MPSQRRNGRTMGFDLRGCETCHDSEMLTATGDLLSSTFWGMASLGDHAVNDDGLPAVNRSAFGSDPIDRLIVAIRVPVPSDLAVVGEIDAKAPVKSGRERKPWNGGNGGGLGGTASRYVAATGMRGPPDLLPGFEFKRPKSSAVLLSMSPVTLAHDR